jgi:hypothetical protein
MNDVHIIIKGNISEYKVIYKVMPVTKGHTMKAT